MSRWLIPVSLALLACLSTRPLDAREETSPNLGGRLAQLRDEQSRKPPSPQYLIQERAMQRARERAERLEARRRMGVSPNRPTIPYTKFGVDLNEGLHNSWGARSFPNGW